jgi:protocatechuate 3,4-dioxygenase beta subunit
MMKISIKYRLAACLLILVASACTSQIDPAPATPAALAESASNPETCQPTAPDAEGPFYKAGAPQRDKVGEGYVLTGVVRSSVDCMPIPGAQIEFWMAGPDGEYRDEYRATLNAVEDGSYRFESHAPPPYSGRPPHIHLRITAKGYTTLITQHYPEDGTSSADFDVVLVPES